MGKLQYVEGLTGAVKFWYNFAEEGILDGEYQHQTNF